MLNRCTTNITTRRKGATMADETRTYQGGIVRTLDGRWFAQVPVGDGRFKFTDGEKDVAAAQVGEFTTVRDEEVPEDVRETLGAAFEPPAPEPQQPSRGHHAAREQHHNH